MKRVVMLLLMLLSALCARAQEAGAPRLVVSEPFVELHTGPGRGYPVFHVVRRGESALLLLAHTTWVKLRTGDGSLPVLNPNYGNATSYQTPLFMRFGARLSF